jgi:hypothetical protein
VQRCEAGCTYGHVVELTDEKFGLLDGFEGGYSLHEVTVHLQPDDSPRQAWTYISISDSTTFQQPPSPAYLTAIHVMLREHFNVHIDQRRCVASGGVLEASFPSFHSHATRFLTRAQDIPSAPP